MTYRASHAQSGNPRNLLAMTEWDLFIRQLGTSRIERLRRCIIQYHFALTQNITVRHCSDKNSTEQKHLCGESCLPTDWQWTSTIIWRTPAPHPMVILARRLWCKGPSYIRVRSFSSPSSWNRRVKLLEYSPYCSWSLPCFPSSPRWSVPSHH